MTRPLAASFLHFLIFASAAVTAAGTATAAVPSRFSAMAGIKARADDGRHRRDDQKIRNVHALSS
jgi:hypothetical protein